MSLITDTLTFLKIVFFGQSILLTQDPIELNTRWQNIELVEPLSIVSQGASLRVRLDIEHELASDYVELKPLNEIENESLPEGIVQAMLTDSHGKKYLLRRRVISVSKEYFFYSLVFDEKLNSEINFTKLEIISAIKIKDAKIFWQNYKK